jgi:hypothetical protein
MPNRDLEGEPSLHSHVQFIVKGHYRRENFNGYNLTDQILNLFFKSY